MRKCNGRVEGGSVDSGCPKLQKIFGLCGLKGHIVKIRWGVTLEDGRTDDGM